MSNVRFVLGSRSPQRRELFAHLVALDRLEVVPPRRSEEVGFDGLETWPAIMARLLEISKTKADDVANQIAARDRTNADYVLVTADTTIVATDADGKLQVLGQPPETRDWQDVVRGWFRDYYAGRSHSVLTGLTVSFRGERQERVVRTEVSFYDDVDRWLDWYLATGEPRGKAGGYALQGAASVFVSSVNGSASNVIGLPLRELLELFAEFNLLDELTAAR